MEGKDLVVLRRKALSALDTPPAAEPPAQPLVQPPVEGSRNLLAVFATSAVLSVAVMMWLHILADTKTNSISSVQSVSIQAQTPPSDVETARSFEIMAAADPTERTQEAPAAAERTQEVAAAELEPAVLQKFQVWASQRAAVVPTENAQPLNIEPAKGAEAKASAAQDREREQEALADKRWEERHARRLAARKTVRVASQPPQPQPPQQQQQAQKQPQQAQKLAPTASATPPVAPQASDSQRGGG